MRQIADNETYTVPSTIEDATILDDLTKLLRG
jgi:propionyl-CoA synthetase